jgi:hypothetical protein
MADKLLPVELILPMLAAAPQQISALTAGLPPDWLQAEPLGGGWSASDVLAHLRSCADVWGRNIATILAEERPSIRAVSPRAYIQKTDYPLQPFPSSLQAFTTQRAGLLAVLEPLPAEAWAREATVKAVGRPSVRTVHTFADRLARHEREHIRQIAAIAASLRG